MSYIDKDGEKILTSRVEISDFITLSECLQCFEDGLEMLMLTDFPSVTTLRIVFSTKCEHPSPL